MSQINTLDYRIINYDNGKGINFGLQSNRKKFFLDDNFSIKQFTTDEYINAYMNNGFLKSKKPLFAFENGISFCPELDEIIEAANKKITKIITGDNGLELIAKMNSFLSYYESCEQCEIDEHYCLSATYDQCFERKAIVKNTKTVIDGIKINKSNSETEFAIAFDCSSSFEEKIIEYQILCCSPYWMIKEFGRMDAPVLLPSHIVCNLLDVNKIGAYILLKLNQIKANTLEEYTIKLMTFTNSLTEEKEVLLHQQISLGNVNAYQLEKDTRLM